ncbi:MULTISPECIES: lysophospholipid acyltransferase family protein [unclassified Bartonella]|uniref:lysophospholipid acyltransferase family protein n=1 Tax=unclassified Bartonella TaxID=2645622 RepID=UPI0015F8A45C|nr:MULTISPECIES: lysophospholipid acyltransferase family protein [unclassified Bartonella]UXN02815.1 1-acyl-sn-glycerol-3-phosphate acyltransferase [Bartonella sp. HY406]UXN05779.1 1-acyl-sn-glycerol-3-phosphate acyltransferase [Bartonella sp. HY761]
MAYVKHSFDLMVAVVFVGLAKVITGVKGFFVTEPDGDQTIYYANHASHGDLIVVMAALPRHLRPNLRAVAAADYWNSGFFKRYIAQYVLNVVTIERQKINRHNNPLHALDGALDKGCSLLIFPEGTRNMSGNSLLPFRSGLYQLAKAHPTIRLVPCWIDNMTRILPKGALIPVPLLCRVQFGAPIYIKDGEMKLDFLNRAQNELLALANVNNVDVLQEVKIND